MSNASKLRFAVIVLLLLASGLLGIVEGVSNLSQPLTPGQRAATVSQLLYGVAAALALASMFRPSRWTLRLVALWGVGATVTSALAPVVWGGAPVSAGAASGAGAALMAALMWFGWRAHERARGRLEPAHTLTS